LNIVFDLGGVVLLWDPVKLAAEVCDDPGEQEKLYAGFFSHPDWVLLDRGVLDMDEAITRGADRMGISSKKISDFLGRVPSSLISIDDTLELIRQVKKAGHKLFILSNMHTASIDYLEKRYSFFDLFDGKVISCRIQMVKPEAEIYQYLLEEHNLEAENTVFIDDTMINLQAASKFGMKTILFESPSQCEEELRRIRVL
jgi:putative hydrolase of the HAD superfamily